MKDGRRGKGVDVSIAQISRQKKGRSHCRNPRWPAFAPLLCIAALLSLSPVAVAQGPEIKGVVFAGVQRGTTGSVLIDGGNLRGATVMLSGRGVQVEGFEPNEKGDYAEIRVSVAPDAPLGPREIRVGSAKGVSGPARLWVDPFPQVREAEPNDDPGRAQELDRTPVVVNGRMPVAPDRDTFSFQADAQETWVFDANCARLRSRLDPILELRDANGHTLKMVQSAWESDPRLIYTFEKAGRYFLTIRDTQYLAGADYNYCLTVGPLPAVTGFIPRGERPGRRVGLELTGVNLGGKARAIVSLPADTPPGEFWTTIETERGPSLPIPLLVNEAPVTGVTETNATMPLPLLPTFLDGAFQRYPRMRFFVRATPKDRLLFDLWGRRIGSRIDGALRILDSTGREVAANDDAIGKDARLEFVPPREGVYTIEARNVEEKIGPDCFYRLEARRVAPDFRLMLNVDRLHVGAGGTAAVMVVAERLHGFNGPIEVRAEGLPPGVVFSGGTIAPGQSSLEVTLTAPPDAPHGAAVVHLRGVAALENQTAIREAVPRHPYLPRAIDPGTFTDDSYRPPYRAWDILPLGVIERAEPFALEAAPRAVTLAPGQTAGIVVRAVRRDGADGEIKLELRGLPDKVTATAPPIAAGQTETRVILTAAPDAPASLRNLILQGRWEKAVQPAPAVRCEVVRSRGRFPKVSGTGGQ